MANTGKPIFVVIPSTKPLDSFIYLILYNPLYQNAWTIL